MSYFEKYDIFCGKEFLPARRKKLLFQALTGQEEQTMRMAASEEAVAQVLTGKLGTDLVRSDGFLAPVTAQLNGWVYDPGDLAPFLSRLESVLLQEVYTRLGKGMRYRQRSGQVIQVRLEDLSDLADDCLALILPGFPPSQEALPILQNMAFRQGSYAALLTLYRTYRHTVSPEDLGFLRRAIDARVVSDAIPECLRP